MARVSHVVILAMLAMFAVMGVARATQAPAPSSDEGDYDYEDGEFDHSVIGTAADKDGPALVPSSVVAAPIGGPVPPGAFDGASSGGDSGSGAAASFSSFHCASAVAGAALAGFFFYF